MPNSFTITTATNTIQLDDKRTGNATFTAFNAGGRAVHARARVTPQSAAIGGWLSLEGEAERDFGIAAAQQYNVRIAVPPTATPGSYSFQLSLAAVDNPDEDFTISPSVTFDAPPPVAQRAAFPWWIPVIVGVVALLLVGGLVAYLISSGNSSNQNATATALALTNVGTQTAVAQANADSTAAAQATVTVVAQQTALTQTASSVQTSQANAANLQTKNALETVIAGQTRVAATAIAQAQFLGRFSGTWVNEDPNTRGIPRLEITNTDAAVSVHSFGACSPTNCDWGIRTGSSTIDPLVLKWDFGGGLTHQLTITRVSDRLKVVDVGSSSGTNTYSFKPILLPIKDLININNPSMNSLITPRP